jgi:hypothetical protein
MDPENTRPPLPNEIFEVDNPPMTGSLMVVHDATSFASPRSTRGVPGPPVTAGADEVGAGWVLVGSSALAVRPVLAHDASRNAAHAKLLSRRSCGFRVDLWRRGLLIGSMYRPDFSRWGLGSVCG